METTIFAKKRHTRDGKTFFSYIGKLTKKDGTEQTVTVKFRDECPAPKPETCPVNIRFAKESANVSPRRFTREDTGEVVTTYTLWLSAWEPGEAYVDHSMDDFV